MKRWKKTKRNWLEMGIGVSVTPGTRCGRRNFRRRVRRGQTPEREDNRGVKDRVKGLMINCHHRENFTSLSPNS